jgi:hypothetical protein
MTNGPNAPASEPVVHLDVATEARAGTNTELQKFTANVDVAVVGKALELASTLINRLSASAPSETPDQTRDAERAKQDIQSANDSARAAIQAAILINGGAAVAILAYLSKDTQAARGILQAASWSLGAYAFGVFSAAISMWCQTQALAQYAYAREAKLDKDAPAVPYFRKRGQRWLYGHWAWFTLSILSFIGSSCWMAREFFRAIP